MKDIQQEHDTRNIQIDRVGVKGVSYPVSVMQHENNCTQDTIASVSMSVMLPHEYRGTHMSRFIETLEEYHGKISPCTLEKISARLCEKLDAPESSIKFEFPYYIKKNAPVTNKPSYSRYEIALEGIYKRKISDSASDFDLIITIGANVQTLCPCSKEISKYGAHNQRAFVNLKVRCKNLVWFEELISMIENSASSPLYTLLKRADEKFVTEHAYENPRFVEDVLRELALRLNSDERITWYKINVTSFESIHNHDAFAEIERLK